MFCLIFINKVWAAVLDCISFSHTHSFTSYLPAVHPKEGEPSVLWCKVQDEGVKCLQWKGLMLWDNYPASFTSAVLVATLSSLIATADPA